MLGTPNNGLHNSELGMRSAGWCDTVASQEINPEDKYVKSLDACVNSKCIAYSCLLKGGIIFSETARVIYFKIAVGRVPFYPRFKTFTQDVEEPDSMSSV